MNSESLFTRWARKVEIPDDHHACWIWRGRKEVRGYGRIGTRKSGHEVTEKAHRVAWMLFRGKINNGLCVLHRCDNLPCVNPDHLFLGTQADNIRDMVSKCRHAIGERQPSSRLTSEDVLRLRCLHDDGISNVELGRRFGVSESTARRIVLRQKWSHVP